jgi:DNA (cytosine-5)-methyltransferase 1
MRYRKKVFSLGELFCGPGGLALGAMNAHSSDGEYHIIHKWANDFDLDTCKTYIQNICPDNPDSVICDDVRNLKIKNLGKIDAFAYGFPCNSFSQVGEHEGLDNKKYGQLYWYGVEVLREYKPKWFLAENVSGITSAGAGQHFQQILKDLEDSGYVLTTNLYKFEQYGVPQTRHRIIIVGIRKDLDKLGFKFKVPSPEPYKNCDVSSKTALKDIPKDAPNNEMRRMSPIVVKRLSYIKPGQNAWTSDLPENLRIKTKTKISQIYRKLDPAKPSYTVTAAGGGGTYMYHWEQNRELTNRERARIQTFPDNFEFEGNYSSVRKQIGMAVPPRGAEIIFNAILDCFAGIDYPSVEPSINE